MPFKFNPLTGKLDLVDSQDQSSSILMDTRENIISSTPDNGTQAFAIDTQQFYIYQDSQWLELDTLVNPRNGSADMGVVQDSSLTGYGEDYVTDKRINNCSLGSNADEKEGAIRKVFADSLNRNLFQFYASGQWQTVLTGVNIQTDRDESTPDIEFTDFVPYFLSLITGNSDAKDFNGESIIKEMKMDMGAFSTPLTIDGGSF